MSNSTKPIKFSLRIDWSEMDLYGHVNNVSFFKYVQAARVNYWEKVGIVQMHKESQIGPMLASCKCDFRSPLFYPGNIVIETKIEFIKNTSFGLIHHIYDDAGKLAATASDVMVMYDFANNQKVNFPESLKEHITTFNGSTI